MNDNTTALPFIRRRFLLILMVALCLAAPRARADVFTNVAEASGLTLVYDLDIPNAANFNGNVVPYSVDNTASIANGFDRIAYYLELDGGQFAYASMDAFTGAATKVGVPNTGSAATFQQVVANMNVVSNVGGIVNGTGIATGNVEFWPGNYDTVNAAAIPGGNGTAYDFGDRITSTAGYGSMQIHNHGAGQTIMAYNRWGTGGGDVGIGNAPGPAPHTDWTFTNNAGTYTTKRLQVLVRELPPPAAYTNVPEAADFELLYGLNVPDAANYGAAGPAYFADNSAAMRQPISRIAYYVELDSGSGTEWVWASLDPFTHNPAKMGVPTLASGAQFQQLVTNMNVATNVPGKVTPGVGIAAGNIEFWPTNYQQVNSLPVPGASGSRWDFGDNPSVGNYGSMQLHNHGAAQTIFAFNKWGGFGGNSDLGIGNAPAADTDWTFQQNAPSYNVKRIYVFVEEQQQLGVYQNVPEATDFDLVYALHIPDGGNTDFNATGVPYAQDNSASITLPLDRIAYYMELQTPDGDLQYAYVSMDAFTNDPTQIGVPDVASGAFFQQNVQNMNVVSNVPGIVTGDGIATGNIEFWPSNYGTPNTAGVPGASAAAYDFGDGDADLTAGYGSMQIHNHDPAAAQTILAYNAWGSNTRIGDVGIGNNAAGNPDWTFMNNAAGYRVKNLYVLVRQVPEPSAALLLAIGGAWLASRRRRRVG